MLGRLNGRVDRLENGRPQEYPKCGGHEFGPHDTYEVQWVDSDGPDNKEEFCEECGRQLVYVITWGDLPDEREERRS